MNTATPYPCPIHAGVWRTGEDRDGNWLLTVVHRSAVHQFRVPGRRTVRNSDPPIRARLKSTVGRPPASSRRVLCRLVRRPTSFAVLADVRPTIGTTRIVWGWMSVRGLARPRV